MHNLELLRNATATGSGSTVYPGATRSGKAQTTVQIYISGTATVVIEGRTSPTMPWVSLASLTASGQQLVNLMPQMRGNVTAFTSGSCYAELVDG